MMRGNLRQGTWNGVTITWMCMEIGQFVEARTWLGQELLFWPLWCCLVAALIFGTCLLDLYAKQ